MRKVGESEGSGTDERRLRQIKETGEGQQMPVVLLNHPQQYKEYIHFDRIHQKRIDDRD